MKKFCVLILALCTICLVAWSAQIQIDDDLRFAGWTEYRNHVQIATATISDATVGILSVTGDLAVDGRISQSGSAADTGYMRTNSTDLASTTALNPGLLVYGGNGVVGVYGMDIGHDGSAYGARIFGGGSGQKVWIGSHSISVPTDQSTFTPRMTVEGLGDIGIGITNPTGAAATGGTRILHVDNPTNNSAVMIHLTNDDTGNTSTDGVVWEIWDSEDVYMWNYESTDMIFATNNAEVMRLNSGNVGIGETAPTYRLDVSRDGDAGGAEHLLARFHRAQSGATSGAWLDLAMDNDAAENTTYARLIQTIVDPSDGSEDGSLIISTMRAGTVTEAVRVLNSGDVGIGDNTPDNKLSVTGRLNSSGGYIVGSSSTNNLLDDSSNGSGSTQLYIGNLGVSTSFTAPHFYKPKEAMERGDAVVLIPGGAGQVNIRKASQANDPNFVGVFWGLTNYVDSTGETWVVDGTQEIQVVEEVEPIEWIQFSRDDCEAVADVVISTTTIIGYATQWSYQPGSDPVAATYPIYATATVQETQLKSDCYFKPNYGVFVKKATQTITVVENIGVPMKAKFPDQEANAGTYAYGVAVMGDSFENHSETPLLGAKVTVANGIIGMGDLLTTSPVTGWLQKQDDNIWRSYTAGSARQPIIQDTTYAYIYIKK